VLHRTQLEPRERDLHPVRGAEALSLVTILTREAWTLSGRPWPTYTRAEIPIEFVRR
jgi:hypothetical protein